MSKLLDPANDLPEADKKDKGKVKAARLKAWKPNGCHPESALCCCGGR